MIFKQNSFKILIGLSPIWSMCICVGPLWHSNLVLRHFSMCSWIAHSCSAVLHAKCLSKCSRDIFGLIWTQMSSSIGNTLDLTWLPCFDYWVCVLHTFPNLCLTMPCHAPLRHTPCITSCTHMHNTCTHMHSFYFHAF